MKGRIIKFTPEGESKRVTAVLRDRKLTFRRFHERRTTSLTLDEIYWHSQRLAEGSLLSDREPVGAPVNGREPRVESREQEPVAANRAPNSSLAEWSAP